MSSASNTYEVESRLLCLELLTHEAESRLLCLELLTHEAESRLLCPELLTHMRLKVGFYVKCF